MMNNETHVMLDLETMGTSSNAAIIAIGAVRFDPISGNVTGRFHEIVDLQSSINAGLEMDADTVMWWMNQSDEAREKFKRNARPLRGVLVRLYAWIYPDTKVWGNGAAFDNVILSNAYRKCHMQRPWEFYNDRCYRTMAAMYPDVIMERVGTHHDALDDAESQALHLCKILERVSVTGDIS